MPRPGPRQGIRPFASAEVDGACMSQSRRGGRTPWPKPGQRKHALPRPGAGSPGAPVTVEGTKWRQELPWTELPWRPPQNHFVMEPSFSKSFSQGSSWRHLPKTPNRSFLLVFFKQNSFPQELPYDNHFGTGGSVTIMILL